MAQGAPALEQRRLRAELRRFREESGRTQKVVAEALGWSTSKVIRIETGAATIAVSDLRALLHYYDIGTQHANDLLSIAIGKEKTWWDRYRQDYSQQFLNFIGYEDSARIIRLFMSEVVPGVLQTEAYSRALFAAFHNEPEEAERGVRVRLRRQELLTREDGPSFQFVLDEAAVHRRVGGPEVMAAQLARLRELAELPNVSIQILPFTAGAHRGLHGSFTILEFTFEHEDHVVVHEDPTRGVTIQDDPETSSTYLEIFAELQDIAKPEGDLGKFVDPVINAMRASARAD